eukprot:m.1232 g.1232  ORF g.1232 m.1232 type:complete len:81 (-) comp442_c0_seq1:207-449(-)
MQSSLVASVTARLSLQSELVSARSDLSSSVTAQSSMQAAMQSHITATESQLRTAANSVCSRPVCGTQVGGVECLPNCGNV